jgi:hypothetical protein
MSNIDCEEIRPRLTALSEGELTPEAAAHLAECETCREALEALDGTRALADAWQPTDSGRDIWEAVRQEITTSEISALLGEMQALRAEVRRLQSEVDVLKAQQASPRALPGHRSSPLLPYALSATTERLHM